MNNCMEFPETFKEFAEDYGFKDSKEVYTNGSELIPVFRVEQWLEHKQAEILDKISAEIELEKGKWDYLTSDTCFDIAIGVVKRCKEETEGKEVDG